MRKTPKYFFRLNKSLHLFETHCAIWPLYNPNIDLLETVKVTKSGHHLSQDRASKGYWSIPCLTSQTSLHACLQRLNTMQINLWHQTRNRPMPLTCSVVRQMMARFRNFYNVKKVKTSFKKPQCVSNRCKDSFKQKNFGGVMGTLRQNLSEMEVRTFERIQRVIWDHLLPFKGEIIQKQALFSFRRIIITLLCCLFCFLFRSLF